MMMERRNEGAKVWLFQKSATGNTETFMGDQKMMAKDKKENLNLQTLGVASIKDLADGQAAVVIDAAISAAIRDVEDRYEQDEKKRVVTIKLEFEKVGDSISVAIKAEVKVPSYATKATVGRLVQNGRSVDMVFNGGCADEPDQMTIGGERDE